MADHEINSDGGPGDRASAITIAAGTVVMLTFMSHHPSSHGDTPAEVIESLEGLRTLGAIVHGVLTASMIVIIAGLWGFADALGMDRTSVRFAMVSYAAGSVGMVIAALINGFAVAGFASEYAAADESTMEMAMHVMHMAREIAGPAAQLGVLGWSAAVALWSISLLRRGGANLAIGILGLLAGGAPAVMLIAGELPLHVRGFGAFVFAQGAWYLAISAQLWRGRLSD